MSRIEQNLEERRTTTGGILQPSTAQRTLQTNQRKRMLEAGWLSSRAENKQISHPGWWAPKPGREVKKCKQRAFSQHVIFPKMYTIILMCTQRGQNVM